MVYEVKSLFIVNKHKPRCSVPVQVKEQLIDQADKSGLDRVKSAETGLKPMNQSVFLKESLMRFSKVIIIFLRLFFLFDAPNRPKSI